MEIFEFVTSDRIIFGNGALEKVGEVAKGFGTRAFIVGGSGSVSIERLVELLNISGLSSEVIRVDREPDVPLVLSGLGHAQSNNCDVVVGYGGGSVLDTSKAIAALMTNPGDIMDYLEVVGQGKQITNPSAPMIAIPTTAGTGTEVTRNAVIASPEHHVKVSMRSPMMIPAVAIVDPELTYTMPPAVTASTGMDALTQVIEAYVSNRANPITDVIAREGIKRGGRSLLAAYINGQNRQAREDMMLTSLFGGLALANGGLGAVHGFAGPIGGMFNAPHGEICASLLPYVMKYNVQEISKSHQSDKIKSRYLEIAQWLCDDPFATIVDGVQWIEDLAKKLAIPGLRSMGITQDDFERIIEKSKFSSSMQKNPVKLDEIIMEAILTEAF